MKSGPNGRTVRYGRRVCGNSEADDGRQDS